MLARGVGLGRCKGAAYTCFTGDVGAHVGWLVKLHPLQDHSHTATPKVTSLF